jgi:ABC-type Zn uptake system ZnuABC Zn-binding protein ZnuA
VIAARGTGPGIPGLPGDPDSPPAGAPPDMTGPPDPHVWLDPIMAIKEVQNIRDALMARDPAHANEYLANENQYEAALRELDDSVGQLTVELKKRNVTGVDSTFNYFLSRYELAGDASKKAPADVLVGTADNAARLNTSRMAVVLLDPMENGPASTDDYETRTSANMQKLCKALSQ